MYQLDSAVSILPIQGDYRRYFVQHDIEFTVDDLYIYVGTPKLQQGWHLHLTVVPSGLDPLLNDVVPILLDFNIPFKLVRNLSTHLDLNGGVLGGYKIGKVVTVFLDQLERIGGLVESLMEKTKGYQGP